MSPFFNNLQLSNVLARGENNFDLIRLAAALAVMFGHSFWIQPAYGRIEPFLLHTGLEYSGSLAVYTFFLISGILVSSSFERQKSITNFIVLRLMRIFPALCFCVFLLAFLFFPLLSADGFKEAITSIDARDYFIHNSTMFWGMKGTLPNMLEAAPIKSLVNGSLWTLPVEIKCYLLVLFSGVVGAIGLKGKTTFICILSFAGLAYLIGHPQFSSFLVDLTTKPTGYSFYPPAFFIIGMLIYAWKERIIINGIAVCALIVTYVVGRHSSIAAPLLYLTFIYTLLYLASTPILRKFQPKHDYSYGVYLWAFPMQQIIANRYPGMDNLIGLMFTVPMTLFMAAVSWHLIEKPCIGLFKRPTSFQLRSQDSIPLQR